MAVLRFRILNVFTLGAERLSGNPLCVFEAGAALEGATMQALARQFNLSETTFILPSSTAHARVRIFTPNYEMAFAGHPTLGTAHVCRALGLGGDSLQLEMQAGIIPVWARVDRWTLQARPPTWRECTQSNAELAAMLSLQPEDVGARPLWVKAGKEQLIIPLTSEAAVRRATPVAPLFSQVTSEDGQSMAYIFAATAPQQYLSRFFFPAGNALLEDPATGSATANLGGWLLATQGPKLQRCQIAQGEHVGRPSRLFLEVDERQQILVSGEVIELGSGTLEV
jgi:trans-2,3-dihydro-3-hydroxyanthranilate isomerase